MAWYRAGTVSVTNGSAVVTGANTDFVSNTQQGEAFLGPDGRVYEVGLVISATQLSLAGNYQGASAGGQGYALMPTSSFARDLALGAAQLLNTFAGVRDGVGAGVFPDGTLAAPALRFGADQDTGINRLAANTLALVAGGVARATINGDGVTVAGAVSIGNGTFAAANFSTNLGNWSCGIPDGANRWRVIENQFGSEKLAIESAGAVRPGGDNGQSLGAGAYRWSVVYAGTGSINTSDVRTKEDIEPVPDSWLDAWGDVVWSRFRFRDAVEHKGGDARWHLGLIAQDVHEAFAAHGLDATQIGLLCFDRWDAVAASPATEATRDADGKVIVPASPGTPARAAGDRWGLRYDECQAIEAAWQRRRIAQLEARLNLLTDTRQS